VQVSDCEVPEVPSIAIKQEKPISQLFAVEKYSKSAKTSARAWNGADLIVRNVRRLGIVDSP